MRSAFALVLGVSCLATLTACEHEVTYKVGGPGKSTPVRYQINSAETIEVGKVALPWHKTFRVRSLGSLRVDATHFGGEPAWCEIWIDGRRCDREASGTWCACYDGIGTPNN